MGRHRGLQASGLGKFTERAAEEVGRWDHELKHLLLGPQL